MNVISKYFLRGILILIPILITFYVVYLIGDTLAPLFLWLGGRVAAEGRAAWLQTAVGVVISVPLITLVGFLASNWLGARIVGAVERLLDRLPLVKLLHGSIKDLLGAFVGDKKGFDRPVLVALTPDGGTKVAGFVTRDELSFLGAADHVAVYLPQSYNFAGNLIVVPRDRVQSVAAPSSDVMAFLVSGGVSAKDEGAAARQGSARASGQPVVGGPRGEP